MTAIAATAFKANCLDLLDRVGRREMDALSITKHGRVVALLVPPPPQAAALDGLHGFMRGAVLVPEGVDLTAPILDEAFSAESGDVHL